VLPPLHRYGVHAAVRALRRRRRILFHSLPRMRSCGWGGPQAEPRPHRPLRLGQVRHGRGRGS
jgi:hypothetical protein